MAFYRNKGDGTFEDRTEQAGLTRATRRQEPGPDRFQQRRPHGSLHLARRLAATRRSGRACCGTTATALSATSPRRPGFSTRSIPPIRAGLITTTTAGSTSSSSVSSRPTACITTEANGTFEEVSAPGRRRRAMPGRYCKGANWIDFDNDDYPGPVRRQPEGDARSSITTIATAHSATSPSRWESTGPQVGFSCWAWDYDNDGWLDIFATCFDYSRRRRRQGHERPAAQATIKPALAQRERPEIREQDQGSRPGPGFRHDGKQLRRLRQRRLPRLLPGYRRARLEHRWFPIACSRTSTAGASPRSRPPRAPATSRRVMASPVPTGIATATSISSSRWGAPAWAIGITTSSSRTPARGTTG